MSEVGGGTSFGGIEVNKHLLAERGRDYEDLRDHLIRLVASLRNEAGSPVTEWVKRREAVFEGANADKYPDVVFELKPDYGVDRTLFCGTTGVSSTHKKCSGGHSRYGTLMLYRASVMLREPKMHITSVFDVILRNVCLR